MNNRLSFYPFSHISGLPQRYYKGLISFLRSQPGFKELKTKIHLNSPDGGMTHNPGAISASMTISSFNLAYRYKDYYITVFAVLGEIYIKCEKT